MTASTTARTEVSTARREMIADFAIRIVALARFAKDSSFVIECDGLYINENGEQGKLGGMVTNLETAPKYERFVHAFEIAKRVKNGNGTQARPLRVHEAAAAEVKQLQEMIETIAALEIK